MVTTRTRYDPAIMVTLRLVIFQSELASRSSYSERDRDDRIKSRNFVGVTELFPHLVTVSPLRLVDRKKVRSTKLAQFL